MEAFTTDEDGGGGGGGGVYVFRVEACVIIFPTVPLPPYV